jgi:hypothetical protein
MFKKNTNKCTQKLSTEKYRLLISTQTPLISLKTEKLKVFPICISAKIELQDHKAGVVESPDLSLLSLVSLSVRLIYQREKR